MENRVSKLEEEFANLQKILYKMEASLETIALQISSAVNMKENVTRLDERQKGWFKRLANCETRREWLEWRINKIDNKLAWYSVGITIIAIVVPYIVKLVTNEW